ncbi:probable serine/threonine-protein kinase At1g54610 isoform X1 [Durio zibethinus]|uniref:Probable serine/threonine-protein kinase At1g54610 isoform X1 n=1 Tax=Durio zibethinus TaxID=66656 RepID=A0A6P6AGV7_DURZI|nr:probable serine/threonine-protein kinase At1g54610 isoform X1 [Durio zibethinus]XP_022764109.1 probable serine/threonine-protein kinase At1g54610 isoform X1 [Durio zibethinus]
MGCMSSKSAAVEDSRENHKERLTQKGSLDNLVARANSSRRQEVVRSKDKYDGADVKVLLVDKKTSGSNRFCYNDQVEKKRIIDKFEVIEKNKVENCEVTIAGHHPGSGRVLNSIEGEQVAAGWPSWLAAVAGEAIQGWVPRRANTFEKLDKIGQGTYSSVYKARDVIHNKLVALKKVRFDNHDPESVKFMSREIILLRRLDHPNVIKLEGLITSPMSCSLYLVFEYMEHDLVGLASLRGIKFSEPQIKCYMQQLLSGLDHCHSNGVLHRDIKGSNLLIDSNGILKIADFGLACHFDHHDSAPMTSRVVTLWYRPPELLLGASHYGVAIDLWSTGCILGELYSGKPILPGKTEVEQLHKIFKLCGSPSEEYWRRAKLPRSTVFKPLHPYKRCIVETFKDFPSPVVSLMETLLSIDPVHRRTAAFALKSEFFTTQPLACDPSSLPKYPPSKEIDAKLRDEEARRQRAVGNRDSRVDLERRGQKEPLAIPTSNSNTELAASMQRRQPHPNLKSRSQMFGSRKADAFSGFLIDHPRHTCAAKEESRDFLEYNRNKISHSGPLVYANLYGKSEKEHNDPPMVSSRANLSKLSGLAASRTVASEDHREKPGPLTLEALNQAGMSHRSFNELESTGKLDVRCHMPKTAESPQTGSGRDYAKESSLHGRGPRGNKIYVSGPLLAPSDNVDQMLKEHDRKIQEFARRARLDKTKLGKLQAQGKQVTENSLLVSARGAG